MKLINKFPRLDVDLTQLSQIWKEVSRKLDATWHFSRQKWAIFGQIQARGAGCAGVRGVMTESERIVLGEEGEGDSDDSDPVLVMGEASVGGSAGVSAGHSSFSHSTVAPGSSGPFGAPPAAPQAGGGAIRKPRADTVRTILRELGQKTLGTVEPTRQDIRDAVALMKRAVEQGQVRWAEKLGKFEAWLAKQDRTDRFQSFGYDHIPPPPPANLADVVPPGSMRRAGAPAVNNPVTQFTSLFKTPRQLQADERDARDEAYTRASEDAFAGRLLEA